MQRSTSYRPPLPRRPQATNASGTPGRCPFLGTAADPGTSLSFPSDANHCHSTRLQVPVSTIHQENFCLSPNYENCPVFRQHNAAQQEAAFLPAAAVAVAGSDSHEENDDPWSTPADSSPAILAGLGASGAAAATARPPASPLAFPWEEPAHPDFQADMAASSARRPPRRVDARPIVIGLLLLALIPLVWWLWSTVRPGARGASDEINGAIVTLPTLMATQDAGGVAMTQIDPSATPQPVAAGDETRPATAEPSATPQATATMSDLERIAATATALFAAATPVTECAAPSWWVTYSVEAGDTIEGLAATRGIRPEELIVANCLAGPGLEPGMLLRLPPVGVIIVQPGQPTTTATATLTPTRGPVLPTRTPFPFPTPTFPVVIIISTTVPTSVPTSAPTNESPTRQPTRPPAQPTATTPGVSATATVPGVFPTSTPPVAGTIGATQTPPFGPTQTPPGTGPTVTPTPTGEAGVATQTPPAP